MKSSGFRFEYGYGVGAQLLLYVRNESIAVNFHFSQCLLRAAHNGATNDEDRVDSNAINRNTRTHIQSHEV